jgi:hypothetical protein
MTVKSVADIEGPWVQGEFESGLIMRCKRYWMVPVNELPDVMVVTYLSQRVAMPLMIEEARRRLASGRLDDTELYDGQLSKALEEAIAAGGR